MSSSQFEKKQFPKIMTMSYLGQKGYSIFKKELDQSQIDFIKKVGVLKNSGLHLNLIQNSDFFSVYDSVEGVIALAWEDSDSDAVTEEKMKRLVFHFGESVKK